MLRMRQTKEGPYDWLSHAEFTTSSQQSLAKGRDDIRRERNGTSRVEALSICQEPLAAGRSATLQ